MEGRRADVTEGGAHSGRGAARVRRVQAEADGASGRRAFESFAVELVGQLGKCGR